MRWRDPSGRSLVLCGGLAIAAALAAQVPLPIQPTTPGRPSTSSGVYNDFLGPRGQTDEVLVVVNGRIVIGAGRDSAVRALRGMIIDSIVVLTGDSAQVVFGSRARTGVVVIGARRR